MCIRDSGQRFVPRLGLDYCQLGVAVFQYIVRRQRLAPLAASLDAAQCDRILAPDAAAFDHAPACGFQAVSYTHLDVYKRQQQDDVADVAGIYTGGELLRGGQDGGDGLFVVLKLSLIHI